MRGRHFQFADFTFSLCKIHCVRFTSLAVNCWPSENDEQCDVNIEYELLQENLELNDIVISIPVP